MTLLTLSGCKKDIEVEYGQTIFIKNTDAFIKELEEIPWNTKMAKKEKPSRGLLITIEMNQLGQKDQGRLFEEKAVNSWLFRLVKVSSTGNRDVVDQIYIPFRLKEGRFEQTKSKKLRTFFYLYYAASAMGDAFERFDCPAFNHQLKVQSFELEAVTNNQQLTVGLGQKNQYKAVKDNLGRPKINGGMKLVGEYEIQIALYDYLSDRIMSNFITAHKKVKVISEKAVELEGCQGVKELPPPVDENEKIKKFKFGK